VETASVEDSNESSRIGADEQPAIAVNEAGKNQGNSVVLFISFSCCAAAEAKTTLDDRNAASGAGRGTLP
jgi:hypothetical protein